MVLPAMEKGLCSSSFWLQTFPQHYLTTGNADETFQPCREKESFKPILKILANQADLPVEYNQVQIICKRQEQIQPSMTSRQRTTCRDNFPKQI